MPVPTIFLIDNNNQIIEMSDQPYDTERVLQELLAKFPSVLAGDQMNGRTPLKWLLVSREAGIPCEEGGAERWSLDHVFIDQDGIPTLVEVKRSSDTRIRREVVGQMLDYAANAVLYWPVETIRRRFREMCSEPDTTIAAFIGCTGAIDAEATIDLFWDKVETNLRAGKIRLIFAADEIPPELRRVVEFLNEQMNPAEVLAIEIRQYVGTGVRTLVPSVIQSSKRVTSIGDRASIRWDRESFVAALLQRRSAEVVAVAEKIFDWASTQNLTLWWGKGKVYGTCGIGVKSEGVIYYPVALWTNGSIQLQFRLLQQRSVPMHVLEGLVSRLNSISGINIPSDALGGSPDFEMTVLKEQQSLPQFTDAIGAFVEQIKTAIVPPQ